MRLFSSKKRGDPRRSSSRKRNPRATARGNSIGSLFSCVGQIFRSRTLHLFRGEPSAPFVRHRLRPYGASCSLFRFPEIRVGEGTDRLHLIVGMTHCGFASSALMLREVASCFRPFQKVVHWSVLLLGDRLPAKEFCHIVVPPDMIFCGNLADLIRLPCDCGLSRPCSQFVPVGLLAHRSAPPCQRITFHESYFLFLPLL